MFNRRNSKAVKVGNITIGGDAPVSVQSMLNTKAEDSEGCVKQALELESAGCEIIRTSVPSKESLKTVYALKSALKIPVVADIHFDYRLALECVEAGIDKIRINPGNIGDEARVKAVANKCANNSVPIRIGVNSGSVEKHILEKYGNPCAEALCESAMYHASLLEKYDFDNIIISVKSSDVKQTVEAYRLLARSCIYPLHIGVTEAGTKRMGIIKSSAGIGSLLLDGIGDTIRVSLTAPPVEEVYAGFDILSACGLRRRGVNIISCPTCGRTSINLIELAERVDVALRDCDKNITVAVMGCIVNGPGEALNADVGIAGGKGCGVVFRKGEIIRNKVPENELFDALMEEINKI